MKRGEESIRELRDRLHADVLALNGKAAVHVRRFDRELLLSLAVTAGVIVLAGLLPRAQRNALLKVALLTGTRVLQGWIASSLL
jgi:hypothetical protein